MAESVRRLAETSATRQGSGLDLSDPELGEAWNDVRASATDTNWCLFQYDPANKNKLIMEGKGAGGLEEMEGHLVDDKVFFGALKCVTKDTEGAHRTKFLFVTWIPDDVGAMKKARASQHLASVKKFVEGHHSDIFVTNREEISRAAIESKILGAGGAHTGETLEV